MKNNTTISCPEDLSRKIKLSASLQNMYISEFINFSLDKNLPLKSVSHFRKSSDDEKLGVIIPDEIKKKILDNQSSLSSSYRNVKQKEIILQCASLECCVD